MDYRNMVALFSKTLTMDMARPPACSTADAGRMNTCWAVLGYFDFLQIYPLAPKTDSWLGDVLRHNQQLSSELDGDYYFHPLHLTTGVSREADPEEYQRFWTGHDDKPFLFLSLVHEAAPGSVPLIQESIMSSSRRNNVPRLCYHTMELSDLAVVWRSGSLWELFQEIQDLYRLEAVGDMSTFSAIDQEFINLFAHDPKPEIDPGRALFASSRYIVRSVEQSHNYLRQLEKMKINVDRTYFSTGMEDLHLLQENISAADFLYFLYVHLNNPYQQAFFECSTRLGIPENFKEDKDAFSAGSRSASKEEPAFSQKCKLLLTNFQATRKSAHGLTNMDQSWVKPTSSLLNALADMSKNWVMDGFCYLIYDAARLFCEKIRAWNVTGRSLDIKKETNLVQRFVRGWGGLMEQATRTDGRFIQMPGFSPAVCEIPAHLLECYLSVMMCCASLMVVKPEKNDVALLLVPKICRRVKVHSVLDEIRSCKHLLYVDIPMEMLYDPIAVLCGLCHELAHNVGDTWRNRKERGTRIIYAAAYELANRLGLDSPPVIQEIYATLKNICQCKGSASIDYMAKLPPLLYGGMIAALKDDAEFSRWTYLYQTSENLSSQQIRAMQKKSTLNRNSLLYEGFNFFQEMENLIYLFRECYADMVMLYLLKPDQTTYEAFAIQELRTQTQDSSLWTSEPYSTLVERWGLVISVMQPNGLWAATDFVKRGAEQQNDPTAKRLHADICDFIAWFHEAGGEKPNHRSKETLQQVYDYLSICYRSIDMSFHCDGPHFRTAEGRYQNLTSLRMLFSSLSNEYNVDYEAFEGFIALYRKSMIQSSNAPMDGWPFR